MKISEINNEIIKELRSEAIEHGDDEMRAICNEALLGNAEALKAVQDAINAAQAMLDD